MPTQKDRVFEELEKIRNLPTLPSILHKVQQEVRDPQTNADRLARLIEDDPSMTARILKAVNSPLYAGTEPVHTLRMAVARLGLNAISNIALTTCIFEVFSGSGPEDFNRREFWKHNICNGIAANVLHERCAPHLSRNFDPDVLHTAGLLHDIGKIVLDQHFHEEFVEAIRACRDRRIPLFIMELEVIGADHAQVGAWLAERWRLTPDLKDVIRWHHEPANAEEAHQELTMLCHVANYICNIVRLGESGDAVAPSFFRGVWKQLGVDVEDVPPIIEEIRSRASQSEILLALME